jgi:ribosomal protein L3 glutamine methyltransferase
MAKRTKAIAKRKSVSRISTAAKPNELHTLLDFLRYAVSRFSEAEIVFAHGTADPVAEAAFLVTGALHLQPDQFDTFATARITLAEAKKLLALIEQRVKTRKPAAYLLNKIYMRGLPFYVDERVIVPRSFIGELLDSHFSGESDTSLIENPAEIGRVLDLCTGSGCLAILAAQTFYNADIDAVDISKDALAVAAINVADYGLDERITLHKGDLFAPLGDARYDLIISNPPYVDAEGMAGLPPECRHEPRLAFDGGKDGIAIVRRILKEAARHLTPEGSLLCEVGRCRAAVEDAFPHLPLLWLDTEESEGEVFWISADALHNT